MDEDDDYNNDLMKAQEDEEGFDQLNSETFGDLGGCNDDWENDHKLFADADPDSDIKPDLLMLEFSNGYSSLYPNYPMGEDVEDCMENDIGHQLNRLVTDDDDDDDKYSSTFVLSNNSKNGSYAKPYDMWNDSLDLSHTSMLSSSPLTCDRSSDRSIPGRPHHLSHAVCDSSKRNGQTLGIPGGVGMTVEELEKILLTGGDSVKQSLPEIPVQSASRLTSFPPPPILPLPTMHRQMIPTNLLLGQSHLHPAQYLPAGSSVYPSDGSAVSTVSHIQAPSGFMPPQVRRDGQSPNFVGHQAFPRQMMPHPNQQPVVSTNCAYRSQTMMPTHSQMLPCPPHVLPQHLLRMMQHHPQMMSQHPPMLPQQPQHLQALPHRSQMLSPQHPHVISQAGQMFSPHPGQPHLPLRPYQYMPPLQHRPQLLPQHGLMLQQQHLFYQQQRQKQFQQAQQILPSQLPLVNKPLQQFPLHQQQMFQQRQMMAMAQHMGFPHPHQYGGQPYSHHGGQRALQSRGEEDPSEYDGLMEQREKDWLIKIQMMQLHTDNPYVDDYYFTCWSMKKIIKENRQLRKMEMRRSNENGDIVSQVTSDAVDVSVEEGGDDVEDLEDGENVPSLLIPQSSKIENKPYEPAQYQGSLGKLTASSIRNPRQIIDVNLSSSAEDSKKHDTKRLKELLGKIEKAFDVLLEVDELEKKASTEPLESRSKLQDEKQERISTLTQKLLCDGATLLQQVLSVRKGVLLVTRLMPLVVETNDVHQIICKILEKLPVILKKEWRDEVSLRIFHSSSNAIASSDLVGLVKFSDVITRNLKGEEVLSHMTQVLQSQLGISVILLMANRAEKLLLESSENEIEDVQTATKWASFLLLVSKCFVSTSDDSVAKPFKMSLTKKLKCQGFIGQSFVDNLKRLLLLSNGNDDANGDGDHEKLIDEVSCKMRKLLA